MNINNPYNEKLEMWNDYFFENKELIIQEMQRYVPFGIQILDIENADVVDPSSFKVVFSICFTDQGKVFRRDLVFFPGFSGNQINVFTKRLQKSLDDIRSLPTVEKDHEWNAYFALNKTYILAEVSDIFSPEYTIEFKSFSCYSDYSERHQTLMVLMVTKVGDPNSAVRITCPSIVSKSVSVQDDHGQAYMKKAHGDFLALKKHLTKEYRQKLIYQNMSAAKERFAQSIAFGNSKFHELFPNTSACLQLDANSHVCLNLSNPVMELDTWPGPITHIAEALVDGLDPELICTKFWEELFKTIQDNSGYTKSAASVPDEYRPFIDIFNLEELFFNETKLKTAADHCQYSVDLLTGELTFECQSFTIHENEENPVYTTDFEKFQKDILSDKFQTSYQFLEEKLNLIKSAGYSIERRSGKGLLSGKGKFRIIKQNVNDFVDVELKLPAYKLKNEEWKTGIDEFFSNIPQHFEQGLNDQIQQAMESFPSWIERDIALIVSGTTKISVYSLSHFLAGEYYSSDYRPFHPEEYDGKYQYLYSAEEIKEIIRSMGEHDVVRVKQESSYSTGYDYDSVNALKKTETAKLLLPKQISSFKMPELTELLKKPILSDYEAQFIYEQFLKKAPSNRTVSDFTILTKALTAKGFLCLNFFEMALLFSKEGSLFGSLIRTYARSIQDKKQRQAMETIAKYADLKPASVGIDLSAV